MITTIPPRSKTTKNPEQIAKECIQEYSQDFFCKKYNPVDHTGYLCELQGAKTFRNFGLKGEKPAYFCQKLQSSYNQLARRFGLPEKSMWMPYYLPKRLGKRY